MKPLFLRQHDQGPTSNISRVFDIESVVSIKDTVLDEEFQTKGAQLDLPCIVDGIFGPVSSIKLPACPVHQDDGMVVLDEITVRINNLLRVIELIRKREKQPAALQKSVKNLQLSIIAKLIGKNGTVCRDILGRRVSRTCRAVLVPSHSHDPAIAFMPDYLMSKMGVQEGEVVIVGRDPTIWHGSLEVLIARRTDGHAIRLHPFVFSQMGADCDGDCVWAVAIPEHLQQQMRGHILSFAKKYETKASMVGSGQAPCDINWDDPTEASESLWMTSGFSIGPEDIAKNTRAMERFREASGKDIVQEAQKIAAADDTQMILDYLLVVNLTMLIQKVYLGPVGAAAQKLKLISAASPLLVESANYMSEQIQQRLFDVKGSVQGDQQDLEEFFETLSIVNMNGLYSSQETLITDVQVLERLEEMGFDVERCRPIVTFIYSVYPLIKAVGDLEIDQERERAMLELPLSLLTGASKDDVVNEISRITGASVNTICNKCRYIKSITVLGSILDDPLYDLVNPFNTDRTTSALVVLKHKINRTNKAETFTRLTDTILDLSLETALAITTGTDEQAKTTRLPNIRTNRGGRERCSDISGENDGHLHEKRASRTQAPTSSTKAGSET